MGMTTRYDEALERGYDGPPPRRQRRHRCGGWAEWSGPCGATDCESCYPGRSESDDEKEWEEDDQ